MTAIISKNGKLLLSIQANSETIELNTPKDCIAVEDPPESNMFYQDGWVEMPAQPSPHFIFDYEIKQWIDPRTIDEIKAQKWTEIKSERDQLEFGGFEFEGNIYDSDQVSQGRIMGAAAAGVDQTWTLANNTTVALSALQLQQLYAALQAHIASVHERGRIARQLIFDAETKEQVESIQLQHLRVLFYYQNLGEIMSETETYGTRIERKLDSVQQEVKLLSETVLRLTVINEQHKSLSDENAKKIERMESDMQQAKGAINLLKVVSGVAVASMITFCTWLVSTNQVTQQRISDTNQKVAVIESKIAFRGAQ